MKTSCEIKMGVTQLEYTTSFDRPSDIGDCNFSWKRNALHRKKVSQCATHKVKFVIWEWFMMCFASLWELLFHVCSRRQNKRISLILIQKQLISISPDDFFAHLLCVFVCAVTEYPHRDTQMIYYVEIKAKRKNGARSIHTKNNILFIVFRVQNTLLFLLFLEFVIHAPFVALRSVRMNAL